MTPDGGAEHALAVERLTVTLPGGRSLFCEANLHVRPGEFTLLVGPSGSGKSTLLRLIAGVNDTGQDAISATGSISVIGNAAARSAPHALPAPGHVGLVFQNLALFDELSALQNVEFARDHRSADASSMKVDPEQLLSRLGVPKGVPLASLSGGERQRVAVARTLAMDPPILLFDEPTGGLDPIRAREVADLIAETHRDYGRTVVVVTHDFEPFLRHNPRLVLVNPRTGKLEDLDEAGLKNFFEESGSERLVLDAPAPTLQRTALYALTRWLEAPGEAVWTIGSSFVVPFAGWLRARWKLRYLWYYLRMVALGTTLVYVAIAGCMLGFVFVTFSLANLPYGEVTLPLLTEEFLGATGYSMYRVVVPLLIGVLMAGKCGASASADLGARRLTHQFEAMRNLGARPEGYLQGNLVIALCVAGPLLTLVGFACSWYASLVAFLMSSPEATVGTFRRNFFALVWPPGRTLPVGTDWLLLKTCTSGILIAALAYVIGSSPKASSVDVSRGVGLTIFWSSLAVLMLHALYSFVEF